jgi:hypothetical protein
MSATMKFSGGTGKPARTPEHGKLPSMSHRIGERSLEQAFRCHALAQLSTGLEVMRKIMQHVVEPNDLVLQ